jgi:purine-nucleoside phosphorylase
MPLHHNSRTKEMTMSLKEKIKSALIFIKNQNILQPKTAVVLGSGLGEIADQIQVSSIVPACKIPHYPESTVPGHDGTWFFGHLENHPILMVRGRVHYYEGYSLSQIAFPIHLIASLGIKTLILTSACGGINPGYSSGDLVIISDHINFAFNNPLIGPPDQQLGSRFPQSIDLYDPYLLTIAETSCKKLELSQHKGVLCWMPGPAYETPAEIRMLRILGADVVSMSTVPEAITASQRHLKLLGISIVTNLAAGLSPTKLTHHDVIAKSHEAADKVSRLIKEILHQI